eukprot:5392514-Pyramimonas_sp.AAC.1
MSVSTKYPHHPKDVLHNHLPLRIHQSQARLGRPGCVAMPPHVRCQGCSTGCFSSNDVAAQPP